MKNTFKYALIMFLTACTSISKNMPSDSSSVTVRHGTLAHMSDVQKEADDYCSSYGKRAYFRARYDANNASFDCR